MSPVHLGVGAVCLAVTLSLVAGVVLYEHPDAQHLLVKNDFEDAKCSMGFYNGSHMNFSIRKAGQYKTRFNAPRDGFVAIRCTTASRVIDAPNSMYMVKGGLTTLTLKPDGETDLVYIHNTDDCRQCVYGVDPERR